MKKENVRTMLSAAVDTKLLKNAVKASNAFLNEARLRLSEEGIAIRAVDAEMCVLQTFAKRGL